MQFEGVCSHLGGSFDYVLILIQLETYMYFYNVKHNLNKKKHKILMKILKGAKALQKHRHQMKNV
jgi:hypothetical protein